MKEARAQAYVEVIQELLTCPNGQEGSVLARHTHLVDRGLVKAMKQYAALLQQQGSGDNGVWLHNFAQQLAQTLRGKGFGGATDKDYLRFLEKLLAKMDGKGDPAGRQHRILQQHLSLLNEHFGQFLQVWAIEKFRKTNNQKKEYLVAIIGNLAVTIQNFPLGSRSDNLEIAISIYKTILKIFTQKAFPKDLAMTQSNLGNVYTERIRGDRAENLELAISACENALNVFTQEVFPQDWAMAQTNLGSAYAQRIRGNREENIEIAITAYENTLKIFTKKAFPQDWAKAQSNLAATYTERIKGDRAENIELAIAACKNAINVYKQEAFSELWAMIQKILGKAYSKRIRGDRAENIEWAITACENALKVYKQEVFPEEWANTQINLGKAYSDRIRGDRAENIELEITACKNALEVYKQDVFPELWAGLQNCLAGVYFKRIRGTRAENIELAIAAYENAFIVFTREAFPQDWAMTKINLGIAYYNRIRGDRAENLELAIAACENALKVYNQEAFPQEWAMTQINLAATYTERIRGDRAENLELAISVCENVLKVCNQEAFPELWTNTKIYLGIAYYNRIRGDRAENLELAISIYENVLKVYNQETFPQQWAVTQNNLGKTYTERIRGDKAENIEWAIAACENALNVFTQETFSKDWAMTQNNLGNAYPQRIRGNRAENLERAITAYKNALKVYNQEAFPQDWAMTQINLAATYTERIRGDRAENLELAISVCEKALKVYNQEAFPEKWAITQNNLASAYAKRIRGDRAENLELAITAYKNTLKIFTQKAFPEKWAITQNNLASAYAKRIRGEKAENLEEAIQSYRNALIILKPDTLPLDCLLTGSNLGNFGFKEGNWQFALEGYLPAIEAVEKIRSWATNDARRREILEEAINIYDNAIQCYINLKQYDKAILLAERARSRHLVELMASADLYQKGNLPEDIAQYLEQYQDLQNRINNLRQQRSSGDSTLSSSDSTLRFTLKEWQAQNQQIEVLLPQKEIVWQKLRSRDPVLAGILEVPPFQWDDLLALWQHQTHTALLSFYSTNDHTHIFIVRPSSPNNSENLTVTLHTCSNQGFSNLQAWIEKQWLHPYQTDFDTWAEQIPKNLQDLAIRLDLNTLVSEHLQGIQELILIPHICLHLIPFAALPLGAGYLGDLFRLRILPSANILKYCQDRENNSPSAPLVLSNNFGTIEAAGANIDTPLSLVSLGFGLLVQSLAIPPDQRLQRQQATREEYHRLAHNSHIQALHSIHHASADLAEPLRSALELADGAITLEELLSPQWRMPQMIDVMLTCCETNLGQPSLTDDILTLGAGFLCAGARSVVSTLWQVDAIATTLFCEFYYQQREQGDDRPTALHQAQQQLRNLTSLELRDRLDKYLEAAYQNKKQELEVYRYLSTTRTDLENKRKNGQKYPYTSPYFWSAFILQGLR